MAGQLQNVEKPFDYTETGLVIRDSMEFEEWCKVGSTLATMQRACHFYVGDWLNAGEKFFPDRYSQALDATNLTYETLQNMAWVARKVPMPYRRKELSWTHHQTVAGMDLADQKKWLQMAIDENLTIADMRYRIRGGVVTAKIGQPGDAVPDASPLKSIQKAFLSLNEVHKQEFLTWIQSQTQKPKT